MGKPVLVAALLTSLALSMRVIAWGQTTELLKHGAWTVTVPAGSCGSMPVLQAKGPGNLFDSANATVLSGLEHDLVAPFLQACPGAREAILTNGKSRKLVRLGPAVAPAAAASIAAPKSSPVPAEPAPITPISIPEAAMPTSAPASSLRGPQNTAPSAPAEVRRPAQVPKPDSTRTLNVGPSQAPQAPFVDLVQFPNQPARHPTASEHRDEPRQLTGARIGAGGPQNKANYLMAQYVSIIDRAIDRNGGKLMLERLPNGKWIAATVQFTMQDQSFATGGYPYLGRIIASKPSDFTVSLSENGLVTGKETGSTDDLRASGMGNAPAGLMSWVGTETLDLNTGLDNWTFQGRMDGHYSRGLITGVKGTLIASESVQRIFTIVPGIDESRTKGDVNIASDPANPRALIIGELKLRSSNGAPILRFSDLALLSVPLINRAGLDLNELRYTITTAEKIDGILDPGQLSGAFRIARDSGTELSPSIGTGFGIPAGGVNFVVTIHYRNTVLGRKTLSVPTEPFYRESQVHLPDAAAPRLRAVAKYFGTGGVRYGDPAPELAAMAGRDPMAAMWEAVFQSQGTAGYAFDQEKAYQVARRVLPRLEERARGGDAEGLYLFFYACQLGLEGENAKVDSGQFLDRAASANFLPAKFDRARLLSFSKDDRNALASLQEVYDAGVKPAAFVLGKIHEQGRGVERDLQAALRWYRLGADFGDPAALMRLANLAASGVGDSQPDPAKAMQLARQAAARKFSGGYLFLGRAYVSGRQGVKQDTAAAVQAFQDAAGLGDRDAMLELGMTFLGAAPGFTADERAGMYWIRQAAERESPQAMVPLSKFYKEGKVLEKNSIAARYWWNQAALHGVVPGDNRGLEAQSQVFLDFWRSADFSPTTLYVRNGRVVGDSGSDFLGGVFTGMIGAMTSYYGQQQATIDGLEFIQKRNGKKIYGGTVSSAFVSNLQLKAGQTVSIRAYGIISTGMFSGLANANGLGAQWPEYRLIPNIPTSAVIGKVGDSAWQLVGTRAQIAPSKDGLLAFGLNARDYRNYKGYFDVVVEVPDEP